MIEGVVLGSTLAVGLLIYYSVLVSQRSKIDFVKLVPVVVRLLQDLGLLLPAQFSILADFLFILCF